MCAKKKDFHHTDLPVSCHVPKKKSDEDCENETDVD
jgi:hypothetical protein